jgi:hypothetical protein
VIERERLGLAREARKPIRIGSKQLWQDLHRDIAIELRVPRAIHLSHPPSGVRISHRPTLAPADRDSGESWNGQKGKSPIWLSSANDYLTAPERTISNTDDKENRARADARLTWLPS